jgi:hypothetical protein
VLTASDYREDEEAEWEELVSRSPMATLLHTRAFLGYHGARLVDASVVLRDEGGAICGLMPAAVVPEEPRKVASHPGATFGGVIHAGALSGGMMIESVRAIASHYLERGFERLRYAPVPFIYHRRPSADDLYALFRVGARRVRCDLSCAVDLELGPHLSSRRRRGLSKARREAVEVEEGPELVGELWPVVEANLRDRHGAQPVHSEAELRELIGRLPDEIQVVMARHDGEPVAGVVLFDGPRVSHAQYIASIERGNRIGALDAVFDHCLRRAAALGARFFDFGTSNREHGLVLNDGLYDFKAQFGGGGVAYEQYELELAMATSAAGSQESQANGPPGLASPHDEQRP